MLTKFKAEIPCVGYFKPSKYESVVSPGRTFSVVFNPNRLSTLDDQELTELLIEQTLSTNMRSNLEYGESISEMQSKLEEYGIMPIGKNALNLVLIDENNGSTIEISCYSRTEVTLELALRSLEEIGPLEFLDKGIH